MNESVESEAFVIPSSSGRPEPLHLLVGQELGLAHILDLHPAHDLAGHHRVGPRPHAMNDVRVVQADALPTLDLPGFRCVFVLDLGDIEEAAGTHSSPSASAPDDTRVVIREFWPKNDGPILALSVSGG